MSELSLNSLQKLVDTYKNASSIVTTDGYQFVSADEKAAWNAANARLINGHQVFLQDTAPAGLLANDDLWIDTSKNTISLYKDGAWKLTSSASTGATLQKTKFNVVASSATPYVVTFDLGEDTSMSRFPSVLKLTSADNNIVQTVCSFDNADASSFIVPEGGEVTFDGTMKLNPLKTVTVPMTAEGAIGDGYLFSVDIDVSMFNTLSSIELV